MNRQEIFTRVVTHLLAQGGKSTRERDGQCRYRGDFGRACAAGVLIRDDFYNPAIENLTVDDEMVRRALEASGVPRWEIGFVRELQEVHDVFPVSKWVDELRTVGEKYGVTMPDLAKSAVQP